MTEPLACVAPTSSSASEWLPEASSSGPVSFYTPPPYTGETPEYLLPDPPPLALADDPLNCSMADGDEVLSTSSTSSSSSSASPAPTLPAARRPARPSAPARDAPGADPDRRRAAPGHAEGARGTSGGGGTGPGQRLEQAAATGQEVDLTQLDAANFDDQAAQQRTAARQMLARPSPRARGGMVRLSRDPLYLSVVPTEFSAPRALAVRPRPATEEGLQKATNPQAVDPDLPRAAYAEATSEAVSLYRRLVAAADDIARDAHDQNEVLAEQHRLGLERALDRLGTGLDQGLVQLATRRDFALNSIRSQSDLLRGRIHAAAGSALGRLAAMHRFYVQNFDPVKGQRGAIVARIATGFNTVSLDASVANAALTDMSGDPQSYIDFEQPPAMRAAQFEAVDEHIQKFISDDDLNIANRMTGIENFLRPLKDCLPCEIDRNIQQLDIQENNVATLGPAAVRAARDGALRSVSETQQQLELSVAESHRQTEEGLAAQHDATRAGLISQAGLIGSMEQADIKGNARRNIDGLTGMAGAQSAAVKTVHGELVKASARPFAQFAPAAAYAAKRLRANLQSTAEKQPATVLGIHDRQRDARLPRITLADRTRRDTVDEFARDLIALVNSGYDRLELSTLSTFGSMDGMPSNVGRVADGFVGPAMSAVQADIGRLSAFMTHAHQRVNDALTGAVTPPIAAAGDGGGGGSNPAAEPNMCSIDDNQSTMSSTAPVEPVASTPPPGGPAPRGSAPPSPASCAACAPTPPAATASGPVSSESGPTSSVTNPFLSPGGEPNMSVMPPATSDAGPATTTTTPAAAETGVSSALGETRSAAAFHRYTRRVALNPESATATAGFVGRVSTNLPNVLGNVRPGKAHTALSESGQPNMLMLFEALHSLTALQAAALQESYHLMFPNELTLEAKINERIKLSGVSYVTTREFNMNAALAMLGGDTTEGAINELRASFNFSNEDARIREVMARLTASQMQDLVAHHGDEMRELANQLDDTDREIFLAMMDVNSTRARSLRFKSDLDGITSDLVGSRNRTTADLVTERGDRTAVAFRDTEYAPAFAMEGDPALDREDVFGLLADSEGDARRRTERWQAIQADFGTLPGVIEAISYASPDRAMSRPTDTTSTILLDYATRPVSLGGFYYTPEDAARRRERREASGGASGNGTYYENALAAMDRGMTPQHRLLLEQMAVHGSDSDEARGAGLLVERMRNGGPNRDKLDQVLHIGSADARLGGHYADRSEGEAEANRRRANVFALSEQFRLGLNGDSFIGPIDAAAAQATVRAEFAATLEGDPNRRDIVLGMIDSEHGDMHAVINDAIAREDTAFALTYLRRMDRRQVDAFVSEWNARHSDGPTLQQRLGLFQHHWSVYNMNGAVFTGDTANELELAFYGIEQNDKERGEVALRTMNQQIEQSGALGRFLAGSEYDALLANAQRLREQMGVEPAELDEQGRIRMNDPENGVHVRVNFDRDGNFVPATGADVGLFERSVTLGRITAEDYTRAVDRIGSTISTILVIAAAVISTIATGGAALSIWIPMAVTAAAGLAGVAINIALKGGRYGRDDLVRDLVSTAVQTLTAGLGAAAGIASRAGAGGKLMALRAVTSRVRIPEATLARFMATRGGLRAALTMTQELRNAAVIGAFSNAATTALDPAARRSGDYGSQVFHSFWRGGLGGAVNAGAARVLAKGVGNALSNSASRSAIARALASGKSDQVAQRFGRLAASRMGNSLFSNIASRSVAGGFGGALSRGVEMGYEARIQGRHYAGSDYFDQISHAFLQNAAQGTLEAVGDRAMRRLSPRREAEHHADQAMRASMRGPEGFLFEDRMLAHAERLSATQSDDLAMQSPASILREGDAAPAAPDEASAARPARVAEEAEGPRRSGPANDDEAPAELVAAMIRADDAEDARPGKVVVGANDNGPAGSRPVYLKTNLADGEVLSMGRVPEGSVFLHAQSTKLEAANDNFVRLINADPSREVAVYHNPDTGEYLVIQGGKTSVAIISHTGEIKSGGAGFPVEALARRGGRWLLRHHFHPNREGWTATNMARVLASGRNADMHVMEYEARRHGMASRSSRIYFVHEGELRYTDFGVVIHPSADGGPGSARFWIDYPDPATGQRIPRQFDGIDAYQTFFREQTAGDAPYIAPSGPTRARTDDAGTALAPLDPARRVGSEGGGLGETLTPANRTDAAFVGQRMNLAAEFQASRLAGSAHASGLDPVFGRSASIADAHAMVTRMGLVDRPESMQRLAAVLNDPVLDPATKGQILEAVREATRQAMVRDGRLAENEPLFLTLHGAPDLRARSIRGGGIDLTKVTGGERDDFSRAFYTSTGIRNAIRYMTKNGGTGEIFPALLRQRDLGTVVDVTPNGQHRAQWEAFVRTNMELLGPRPEMMVSPETSRLLIDLTIAASRDAAAAGRPIDYTEASRRAMDRFNRTAPFEVLDRVGTRGILFDAFLAHLGATGDPRLANPDIVIGELGGVLTSGIGSGDQQAIRSQRIADLINDQLGVRVPRIAADDAETGPPKPGAPLIEVPGVAWPVREVGRIPEANIVDLETHRLVELGFEEAFGPIHRQGGSVDDISPAERAAAQLEVDHRTAVLENRIFDLEREKTPHGKILAELRAAAPNTTTALLTALLPGISADSTPLLHPKRVAAFRAELEARGIKGPAADRLLVNLRTMMCPDNPIVRNLADLAERFVSPASAHPLNTLGAEALARLIDVTEIERIAGLVTLPAGELIARLLEQDADATITAIRTPGTIDAQVEAYIAARRAKRPPEQDITDALPHIRAALSDPKLPILLADARANYAKAGIKSQASLADMIETSPVLRHLAALQPEVVARLYAREMQRLQQRGKSTTLTTSKLTRQIVGQYGRRAIRSIVSEMTAAFRLGSDVAIDVLKANVLRGVTNKGDIDIVAVLRRRAGESPDAPARVLLVDDKAETATKLNKVSAMEGEALINNLDAAIAEIAASRKAWADQGYPPDPLHVRASVQMSKALQELRDLHADRTIGATRPKGRDVPRHRRADYIAKVAEIMERNGITLLITSEYGSIRELAPWMRNAGMVLIDEYIRRLKREGVLKK